MPGKNQQKVHLLNLSNCFLLYLVQVSLKVALSQKVEVDFANCPKWVPKKLTWDLENANSDSFLCLQV